MQIMNHLAVFEPRLGQGKRTAEEQINRLKMLARQHTGPVLYFSTSSTNYIPGWVTAQSSYSTEVTSSTTISHYHQRTLS
jgi:hypothetical protein